jgi:hypothetical protein
MTCAEFEAQLQRQLDSRTPWPEKQIPEHAQTCEACRDNWNRTRLLADAIIAWREQSSAADLVEAVVAMHAAGRGRADGLATDLPEPVVRQAAPSGVPARANNRQIKDSPRRGRWALAAGMAGLVALVAISTFLQNAPPRGQSAGNVARSGSRIGATVPTVEERELALLYDADAAYNSLASSAAGALEGIASIVIPVHPTDGTGEETAPSGERLIDSLPHPLRPLGQGLGDAFDFLWEAGKESQNSRT